MSESRCQRLEQEGILRVKLEN